jgi:uncharacterized membrane protein
MLNQINHWIEYVSAGVDLVLLLRVLALRLQRTYVFLTLACAVSVIFDVANLRFAQESPFIQLYTDLFLAFLFPLAVWDIFEEVAQSVAALRRVAIMRTIASLIIITFFGLVWTGSLSQSDDPTNLLFTLALTFAVSTASASSCLAFLWIMRRGMTLQKIPTPNNTLVWMIFYALLLIGQLISWCALVVEQYLNQSGRGTFSTIANLVINSYGILITIWCVLKLRGLPKDVASASVHENS